MKIALLFGFIVFGVYAQYDAEQTVLNILRDRHQVAKEKNSHPRASAETADARFMARAIKLSHTGHDHGDGAPIGAIVVSDGVIIGEGWDRVKALNDPSAHAEVIAIRDASRKSSSAKLNGSVLYTTVQPCAMCRALIEQIGIEKVYYCIPGERIEELIPELNKTVHENAILSPERRGRVQEIPLMQESVSDLIESYRLSRNKPTL